MSTNVVLQWGCREIMCVPFDCMNGAGESHTRRHTESQSQHGVALHRHHALSLSSFCDMQAFLFFYFHCFPASYFSPHHVFGGSTASLSRMTHMTTGMYHRSFISAPGRSGFILPSPAQRNTALLSPELGCQPLIIEFPIDPLPSARL